MTYSVGFSQAIEILFYIEIKRRMGGEQYLSIQKIAAGLEMPVPSVKRLVSFLKKSGLIASKLGTTGGLSLTRAVGKIRFYDVFVAVEGREALFRLHDDFDVEGLVHKSEVAYMLTQSREIFAQAEAEMLSVLKSKTLADLFAERGE